MMQLVFSKAKEKDVEKCAVLFAQLYNTAFSTMCNELLSFLHSDNSEVFMALTAGEDCIGVVHCSLRSDYVEGTNSIPVGYLEGVFVLPEYRHSGIAKQLVAQCEKWAKDKHCKEFASDCEIDNVVSQTFHEKTGFTEANRIVCYKKIL